MHIDINLQNGLKKAAANPNLAPDEKAAVEKMLELIDNEVYCASYDKEAVVTQAISFAQNLIFCTEDEAEIEEKVYKNKNFFTEVKDELLECEGYPEQDTFCEVVEAVFLRNFETDGNGVMFSKGLADH